MRKRAWRHRLKKGAGKRHILRVSLAAVLMLEGAYGVSRSALWQAGLARAVHTERESRIEWVVPAPGEQAGEKEVYGIGFDRETWGIQFYHFREEITGH